uniref:Uncharacterized protein n=1 Tax=Anguilla anguilla TaxID=7936 RepID=A0A0E9Q0Y0_ANGAN
MIACVAGAADFPFTIGDFLGLSGVVAVSAKDQILGSGQEPRYSQRVRVNGRGVQFNCSTFGVPLNSKVWW